MTWFLFSLNLGWLPALSGPTSSVGHLAPLRPLVESEGAPHSEPARPRAGPPPTELGGLVSLLLLTGINPASLRGTHTGVWVGVSGSEASEALSRDPETLLGYSMVGCQRAMMANRLSFFFDFRGGFLPGPLRVVGYLALGLLTPPCAV